MPIRILGPHERGRFAPDAWGHLLAMHAGGLLTAAELEHVIDRALGQVEGRIALDDIRQLVESAGLSGSAGSGPDQTTVH